MNEEQNINQLPKDWKYLSLRDVCKELQSGKRPKGGVQGIDSGIPSIGAEHLDVNGGFKFSKIKYVPNDFATHMKKGIIQKDDIIVVKDGATTGKTSFVDKGFPFDFAVINEHVFIVRVNEHVLPQFAFYKIWSSKGNKEILEDFRGAAQGGISSGFIDKVIIPLPPKPTQQAIVSKIEELFSELDKGIEQLKTAQQQLKIYRQSVLKWAFEGKLTNEILKDGELPKGWKKVQIKDVPFVNPKLPNKENIDSSLEVQFLPMKLVEEIINKIHLVDTKKFQEVQKGSYTPFIDGDIIFAKVTPCMENGKIAVVDKLKNGIGYGSSEFHVIRCTNEALNKYIFYFLVQDRFKSEAENALTGAVGLRRVPKQFIENYTIPLPLIEEQNKIVQEIESRLSVADKMEESITQSLQQAGALRQSILKKAFEGKLILDNLNN